VTWGVEAALLNQGLGALHLSPGVEIGVSVGRIFHEEVQSLWVGCGSWRSATMVLWIRGGDGSVQDGDATGRHRESAGA
jgi:hypothetical protein